MTRRELNKVLKQILTLLSKGDALTENERVTLRMLQHQINAHEARLY